MVLSKRKSFDLSANAFYILLAVCAVLFVTSLSGNIYLLATWGKSKISSDQKPEKVIEIRDSNFEALKDLLSKNQADGETVVRALALMQDLDPTQIDLLEPNFQNSPDTKLLFQVLRVVLLNHSINLSTLFKANIDPAIFKKLSDSGLNRFLMFVDPSAITDLNSQIGTLTTTNSSKSNEITLLNGKINELGLKISGLEEEKTGLKDIILKIQKERSAPTDVDTNELNLKEEQISNLTAEINSWKNLVHKVQEENSIIHQTNITLSSTNYDLIKLFKEHKEWTQTIIKELSHTVELNKILTTENSQLKEVILQYVNVKPLKNPNLAQNEIKTEVDGE